MKRKKESKKSKTPTLDWLGAMFHKNLSKIITENQALQLLENFNGRVKELSKREGGFNSIFHGK